MRSPVRCRSGWAEKTHPTSFVGLNAITLQLWPLSALHPFPKAARHSPTRDTGPIDWTKVLDPLCKSGPHGYRLGAGNSEPASRSTGLWERRRTLTSPIYEALELGILLGDNGRPPLGSGTAAAFRRRA